MIDVDDELTPPNEESENDPDSVIEQNGARDQRYVPTQQQRVKFFLTGVIFPIGCILCPAVFGITSHIDSPWQSGHLEDYVAVLLDWPSLAPMLPLVIACMICMTAYVFRPDSGRTLIVRSGLIAGAVLSLQYLAMLLYTTAYFSVLFAAFVAPCLALIVFISVRMRHWIRRFTILHVMILTTVVALLITLAIALDLKEMGALELLASMAMSVVAATPTLNFVSYLRASMKATARHGNRSHSSRTLVATAAGWVFSWLVSWKVTTDVMLIEYSKLPVTNPNCYVSSAAAHGHRKLVKSDASARGRVNPQMQRLKFLEFAFAAACPKAHWWVRRVYNLFGPHAAKWCSFNVWFADVTYLMLKPLECVAIAVRLAAQVPPDAIDRIYR